MRRDESIGAKMVVGVAPEKLAAAAERFWKPRAERMVAVRDAV